jgi:hypothetical protein
MATASRPGTLVAGLLWGNAVYAAANLLAGLTPAADTPTPITRGP